MLYPHPVYHPKKLAYYKNWFMYSKFRNWFYFMTDIPKALLDITFFRAKLTFFILIFFLRLKIVNEPRGDESAIIYKLDDILTFALSSQWYEKC